jgi:hypothetical protein
MARIEVKDEKYSQNGLGNLIMGVIFKFVILPGDGQSAFAVRQSHTDGVTHIRCRIIVSQEKMSHAGFVEAMSE